MPRSGACSAPMLAMIADAGGGGGGGDGGGEGSRFNTWQTVDFSADVLQQPVQQAAVTDLMMKEVS